MKFGAVAPKDAIGATAVHTIRQGTLVLKKGTLVGAVEAAALARIHAPIGLAIGAVSPPEIALSIMGEITARLRLPAEAKEKAA